MFVLNKKRNSEKLTESTAKQSRKASDAKLKMQVALVWGQMERRLKMNSVEKKKKGVDADGRDITRTEV